MSRWIVLLRGVNVGGHNKLKMAEFRDALEAVGFENVTTYIQSGNAVLSSGLAAEQVAAHISQVLSAQFGIEAPVHVLSKDGLDQAIAAQPFEGDPSRILIWFCFDPLADFETGPLEQLLAADEEVHFTDEAIYLHARSGIARSKFAAKIDQLTPVQVTARNLRTADKLAELASQF